MVEEHVVSTVFGSLLSGRKSSALNVGGRAAAGASTAAAGSSARIAVVVLGGSCAKDATYNRTSNDENKERDTKLDPLGNSAFRLGVRVSGSVIGSGIAVLAITSASSSTGSLSIVETLGRLLIGAVIARGVARVVAVSASLLTTVALLIAGLITLIVLRGVGVNVRILGSLVRHDVHVRGFPASWKVRFCLTIK